LVTELSSQHSPNFDFLTNVHDCSTVSGFRQPILCLAASGFFAEFNQANAAEAPEFFHIQVQHLALHHDRFRQRFSRAVIYTLYLETAAFSDEPKRLPLL
jgi:hypothetical protein